MSAVRANQNSVRVLSTSPLHGTVASTLSKAEMRSVVVISSSSPMVHHVAHLARRRGRPAGKRGQVERSQGCGAEPREVLPVHATAPPRDFSVRESRP